MNERIKELVELSGFKVDWQHEDVQALKMARFEKFAELIVRECANMLDEDSYMIPELGGYAHDMRKRFGVEE
jgi:hypothetical protein